MISLLIRATGVHVFARLGVRLPARSARTAVACILVAANLLPIAGAIAGTVGAGDLFALYWLENLVVMVVTVVQIRTATGPGDDRPSPIKDPGVDQRSPQELSRYFLKHYGAFTAVHLIFTIVVMVAAGGLRAGPAYWIVLPLVMVLGHAWALGIDWFGRNDHATTSPVQAVVAPYPRIFLLQFALLLSFAVIMLGGGDASGLVAVVVLCGLKTLLDLLLYFGPPIRLEIS